MREIDRNKPQKKKHVKRIKSESYIDYTLLCVIMFLICFGTTVIYSTSYYWANNNMGSSSHFLKRQVLNVGLGIIAMCATWAIDYRYYMKWKWAFYVLSLLLLIMVSIFGKEINGQKRWLEIGPISWQPSELVKILLILFLAAYISQLSKGTLNKMKNIMLLLLYCCLPIGIVALTNLSTALIMIMVTGIMLFISNDKMVKFIGISSLILGVGMIMMVLFQPYRLSRIYVWLDPASYPDKGGFQTLQGLYAIGSGGIFGKGLGQSMQKLGVIPEAQNDMVFTILCEELGLFGALSLIVLFVFLIWRCMIIANNAQDLFGSMIVVGVMSHIAVQVILNIAVATNSIPNTGVILPFISYGGTSYVFLLAEIGIVLSVAKKIKIN